MVLTHEKARVDDFGAVLARLEGDHAASVRQHRKATAIGLVLLAGVVVGLFFFLDDGVTALIVSAFPGFIGLFVAAAYFSEGEKRRRAREKATFVRELYELLADELAPRSSIVLDFDLRHYGIDEKRTQGPGKALRYTDKWLHLRATLADGTALEVVRQAGIKIKTKHGLFRERRRLVVRLRPHPGRYPLGALAPGQPASKRLKHGIEQACDDFHDEPEAFHARLEEAQGELVVRVDQEDAPILPREVLAVIERALVFLASLRTAA